MTQPKPRRPTTPPVPPAPAYTHEGAQPGQPIDLPGVDLSGTVNRRRQRDTANLRALLADTVLDYTTLKRRDQIAHGVHPDEAVQIVEEYDPVVAMALLGVTVRDPSLQLMAHANVAKFVRPTLKSVEVISDAEKEQDVASRSQRAAELFAAIDDVQRSRRAAHDARVREEGVVLDQPEPINVTPRKTNGSALK